MDAALADYRDRKQARRDKKAVEARVKRAEDRAAGIGEDDDEHEKEDWEDDEKEDGPIYPIIPAQVDFYDFLQHVGWTDEETLNRQRADWVHRLWRIYQFELETGILHTSLF